MNIQGDKKNNGTHIYGYKSGTIHYTSLIFYDSMDTSFYQMCTKYQFYILIFKNFTAFLQNDPKNVTDSK